RHGRVGGERTRRAGGQRLTGELINDVQEPDLPAVDGDVDLEVQRPHLIRPVRTHPLMPAGTDTLLLDHPHRAFQPFGDPQPAGAFTVDHQPLPGGDRMGFTPSPPRMGRRDLPQPGPQPFLTVGWRPGWLPLGRAGLPDQSAGPPLRCPEPLLQHHHGTAAPLGAHQFPRFSSLSMSMSSAWSATIFFNRAFSRSSSLSRLASSAFMPPYWATHRCQVASEISRCLATSARLWPCPSSLSPSRSLR